LSNPTRIVQLPPDYKYALRNLVRLRPVGFFAVVVGLSSGNAAAAVIVAVAIVTDTSLVLRALQAVQWRWTVPPSADSWHFPASISGVPGAIEVTPHEIAWRPRDRTSARITSDWVELGSLEIQPVPTVVRLGRIRLRRDPDGKSEDVLLSARCGVVATALTRAIAGRGP